ncbi:McrC family protein [Agathobaculum sp. TL06]
MKQLRIRDNAVVPQSTFCEISGITQKIANKTLKQLEREGIFVFPEQIDESDDLAAEQMILQGVNDCYYSGNVMGFLGYGNERLVITSRFADGETDYFLQYLLNRVMGYPNVVDLMTDADQDNALFHLLVFLFPRYLKAAMRKGIYKTYVQRDYNDSNVKGVIDVAQHITRNTPFVGTVAYHQREYSYDNALMELVRHTIEYIKTKAFGRKLLAAVRDEVALVVNATLAYQPYHRVKIVADNRNDPVRHAYYREYRALQRLCLLILQHEQHQIGSGSRQIFGLLFDGAWLWEEYIHSLLGDRFYHPMNKRGIGAQWLFSPRNGLIYPDFVSRNHMQRVIADAKYKPMQNIGNRDFLQMLAYMFRFDAKKGIFCYPETGQAGILHFQLNKGSTYENNVAAREDICVEKHGLKIPSKASCYESFVAEMKKQEQVFINAMQGIAT